MYGRYVVCICGCEAAKPEDRRYKAAEIETLRTEFRILKYLFVR